MLLIVHPETLVPGAVFVDVFSFAVCLIVDPRPLIHVAVVVNEAAFATGHVIEPLSHEFAAIYPDLGATSLSELCFHIPLSYVYNAIVDFDGPFFHQALISFSDLLVIVRIIEFKWPIFLLS